MFGSNSRCTIAVVKINNIETCSSAMAGFFFRFFLVLPALLVGNQGLSENQKGFIFDQSSSYSVFPQKSHAISPFQLFRFPVHVPWKLRFNTGNLSKMRDFQRIFKKLNAPVVDYLDKDLREIISSPNDIVVHKASQFSQPVLVDDSALHVDGAKVGAQIKWLINKLGEFEGHEAEFVALLAFSAGEKVCIFRGSVKGKIVKPRGEKVKGFEFNPFFLPHGASKTLAESFPDEFNPRYIAMKNLMSWNIHACVLPIKDWGGSWQKD